MTRSVRTVSAALVAGLVLAAIALAGCKQTPASLATVNGVAIPASEVEAELALVQKQAQGGGSAPDTQTLRAQILDSLIEVELIKQQAKKLGVDVPTKQVDDYIGRLAAQYGGQANLTAGLKAQGITMARVRDSISDQLLAQAMMTKVTPTSTISVTEAQISDYYKTNKAEFSTPAQVHAAHVLISATDTVLAQNVFAQAKGGANFPQLAKKYSKDGSARSGGDLGWVAPENYVAEFSQATKTMKVGSLKLVKSQFGWHVIKLLGRRPAGVQALSEVKDQIRQGLVQQAQATKFAEYVAELKRKADIAITDAELKKIIDSKGSATTP